MDSTIERDMLALPFRYGGLGIVDPSQTSEMEYASSKSISEPLANCIFEQNMNINNVTKQEMNSRRKTAKKEKDQRSKESMESVKDHLQSRT